MSLTKGCMHFLFLGILLMLARSCTQSCFDAFMACICQKANPLLITRQWRLVSIGLVQNGKHRFREVSIGLWRSKT